MVVEAVACPAMESPAARREFWACGATKGTPHAGHTRLGGTPKPGPACGLRRDRHRRRDFRPVYALPLARIGHDRAGLRGRHECRRHLVLEPLSRRALRLRKLDIWLFLSKELMAEWDWKEHFSPQPDTLEYLNYVADQFDLRRDIEFRSTVAAAHWDEAASQWHVTLESGEQATARFLFTAIGILSAYTLPAIPGRDSFKGPAYHPARWPHTPVDFTGKRVGIIGTGATAIQAIPEIAKKAKHLTVFQRRPNWAAPLHNSKI